MSIKKILIADDDETTIDSLILWIESIKDFKDAQILTSMDPEQTEAAILKEMPELVFLDLGLGNGISGLEVLKKVKPVVQDKCNIIIFSGYTDYTEDCIKYGASGFIKKGTRFNEFVKIIENSFLKTQRS